MKEYLNVALGSIIGVILAVVWAIITIYFKTKYFAKAIPVIKEEVSAMKEVQHAIDKDNALMAQKMESLEKTLENLDKKLDDKFDKFDLKMDHILNYLTK